MAAATSTAGAGVGLQQATSESDVSERQCAAPACAERLPRAVGHREGRTGTTRTQRKQGWGIRGLFSCAMGACATGSVAQAVEANVASRWGGEDTSQCNLSVVQANWARCPTPPTIDRRRPCEGKPHLAAGQHPRLKQPSCVSRPAVWKAWRRGTDKHSTRPRVRQPKTPSNTGGGGGRSTQRTQRRPGDRATGALSCNGVRERIHGQQKKFRGI